jgi:hypothetical protein
MSELMVPIRVDAIWLDRARRVVGPLADYERLPWFDGERDRNGSVPHVASAINAPPFTDHQSWLEPGVHLHWALPDGLTRGATRRSAERPVQIGDLWFPPAPNRWLVLRRDRADPARGIERAWLVESDYVHPPGARPTAAVAYPRASHAAGAPPFFYLGRQIELEPHTFVPLDGTLSRMTAETSLGAHGPALTALGPGDPLFAAYYPACRSVFGLLDDRNPPPTARASLYSVHGWFSEDVVEPLANMVAALRNDAQTALSLLARAAKEGKREPPDATAALSEADWNEALQLAIGERFGWGIDRLRSGVSFPTDIICFGATTIASGAGNVEASASRSGSIAIGSSAAEAVTALLMGEKPLLQSAEDRVVQALSDTDLSDHALDLGLKLAEARHTEQFRAYRGHSIWTIRPSDANAGAPGESAGVTLPDELAHELNLLNALQEEYDRAHDAIGGLRQELFADWSRYMTAAYPEGDMDPFGVDVDAVRELTERTRLEPLEALLTRAGQLFHGRSASGGLLIADRHPVEVSGPLAHGSLAGGSGRTAFADAVPAGEWLAGFDVWAGEIVDDVVVVGARTVFPRRTTGGAIEAVRFAAGEHVTAVFGESGTWSGHHLVSKLGFETNHGRRFGPWGADREPRTPFRLEVPDRMAIVGLRGSAGPFLNAIGILVAHPGHMETAATDPGDTLARRVVDQHRVVQTLLEEAAPTGRALTLGLTPGPRFWRPNDPVVVLNDPVAAETPRHGNDGRNQPGGLHPCRAMDWGGGWTNTGDAFAGTRRAPMAGVARPWHFLEPLELTRSEGENWHALQLEWEVELQPLKEGGDTETGGHAADFVTRSHALPPDSADLIQLKDPARMRTYHYLAGRTILNPAAGRLLLGRLKDVPQEFANALAVPESLMVLPLGGFHDQLLMRFQEPQIAIVDPIGLPVQRAFTGRVRAAVGGLHPTTPMPDNAFHPIRSGEMLIERLRVIDSFGRTKTWRPERVLTGSRMRPAGGALDRVGLPVRFAQGARLDFRWLSAAHGDIESNAHPATSPICGWLLPNDLDGEIAVYARTGHLLGSVGEGGVWLPAPGDATAPRSWREISDVALKRVVRWMTLASATDAIGSFLEMLDAALERIDPQDAAQHQARALLIGRPVAVVRARIGLSLHHPAALDQSTDALRARLAGGGDDTHGVEAVEIPVRLGEHAQLNDGLCGYWIEDGALFREEKFHTPHGVPPGTPHERIRVMGDDPLVDFPIRLKAEGPPAFVTMLVDPRGVVHATCGIVPTKSIGIPPEQLAELAADLRATFVTAPVLTTPDDVALPLPTEPGYSWSWIERAADKWVEVPHHPTVHKADLVAGFGTQSGAKLWDRLVERGRIVPVDRHDVGVLMPGDPHAPAGLFDDLTLDNAAVERGLHDIARAIGEVGIAAGFTTRAVAREGWLQLRRAPVPAVRPPDIPVKAGGGT